MTLYNKLKWVLGILMILGLIITTNLIDKSNFERVRDSVVTIYEDRLIAKDLIYDMLKTVQEKELALAQNDSTFFKGANAKGNAILGSLVSRFEQTKLTKKEEIVFNDLKKNINVLINSENQFVKSNYNDSAPINLSIERVKENLEQLSEIQIAEGRRQMSISKKAVDKVELFTQIEIYILVILAIIIQIIVMYQPKQKS